MTESKRDRVTNIIAARCNKAVKVLTVRGLGGSSLVRLLEMGDEIVHSDELTEEQRAKLQGLAKELLEDLGEPLEDET